MKPVSLRAVAITIALTGALAASLAFFMGSNPEPHVATVAGGTGTNQQSASVASGVEPATDDEVEETSLPEPTPAELAEISKWYGSRGHYFEVDVASGYTGLINITHSYTSLSDAGLQILADANDLDATVLLADRTWVTVDEAEIAKGLQLHTKGAALGSTYSALQIGGRFFLQRRENKGNLISALAWYHFAAGRGDPAGNFSMNFALGSSALDDQVIERVCQRSAEIRRELEQERSFLGLPGYDDTPLPMPASMPEDPMFSAPFTCPGN